MNKTIASILFGFTTLLALSGCEAGAGDGKADVTGAGSSGEAKTYRIGIIAPMTGDAATYGVEMQRIMEYRLAEINREYADKGARFELVYEDGKCDGAAAAAAFQKLTDVDGLKLIIGGVCGSETLGFLPLVEEKGVLAVSWGNSIPELEGKSKNYFTLSYNDALIGSGIADELGKYKQVALVTEQNDYNVNLLKVVEDALAKKYPDTRVVLNEKFPKGGTDLRNMLAKVNDSDAEAVLVNTNPGVTTMALVKQLAEIKGFNKKLVSQVAFMGKDALQAAPETLEGAVVIDAPNIHSKDFDAYVKQIVDAKGTLDNIGAYYTASTLEALNLMTRLAYNENGDPLKIRDDLATGRFSGWIAPSFNFGGKTFVQGVGVAKYVIKNAEPVLQ
jgi:branched-chain amino acid transport system substrate-binding protein